MKKLYLGRWDNTKLGHNYDLGLKKKDWNPRTGFAGGRNYLYTFCPERFEKVTGIKLKPGEIRRIKLTIELQ